MTELALLAKDPDALDAKADPVTYVVLACERAKAWLTDALAHGDIDAIVETKSQAEAIRVYTAQKQMGKDAELAAAEIVRRAERGIGVAIRKGQAAGTFARSGDIGGVSKAGARGGVSGTSRGDHLAKPRDYFDSTRQRRDIYAMADGATDEEFDAVIEEAKAERDLTRSNVARKVKRRQTDDGAAVETPLTREAAAPSSSSIKHVSRKDKADRIRDLAEQGYSSRQMADLIGIADQTIRDIAREFGIDIPADKAITKTRLHDSNRIGQETVNALAGLAIGVDLINYQELDVGQASHWVTSLDESLKVLNQFRKNVRKVTE